MTWKCYACGELFQPMMGHECIVQESEKHRISHAQDERFLTLVERLEKLATRLELIIKKAED